MLSTSDIATAHRPRSSTGQRVGATTPILTFLLVGAIALLLRLLNLGAFITMDEAAFWVHRSHLFLQAIQAGDPARTAISPHPGVTTMWLGSVGIILRQWLFAWNILHEDSYLTMLVWMRVPVALTHVGAILVGYLLLRRMVPHTLATLAALLWATDPFITAYSRVLHVDALAMSFSSLSVLAACYAWHHQGHPAWLVLSGGCAALALLSKLPALAVVPVVGIIWLWSGRRIVARIPSLLLWGGAFLVVLLLAWPAVWAAPAKVFDLLRFGVEVEGGEPHIGTTLFLGKQTHQPGPLFYPVALALRTTPWTLAGLLLLPLASRGRRPEIRTLAALAWFTILFVIAMSLFPKKLNRYAVLVFPALDILAAAGLVWAIEQLARLVPLVSRGKNLNDGQWVRQGSVLLLSLAALLNALWWHPYEIAAFNQALGGASAGARTFAIGWGEGLEQVADWLNQQPDITGRVVASTMLQTLQPLLRKGVQAYHAEDGTLPDNTGYAVIYVRVQWAGTAMPLEQFFGQAPPLHTVRIHGVDYAWIYDVPPPIAHPTHATFGSAMEFRGYGIDLSRLRATGALSLTVQWLALAPVSKDAADARLFVHVLDAQGQRYGQLDVAPAGPELPPSRWQPGRFITRVHPVPLPPDLPVGKYWLALGLYDRHDATRLPLRSPPPPENAPDDGEHVLLLPFEVTR
ncbi:MAG: phospholipid carrier-dependent glycosyltransferase [Chloroflexaceae bacterium]|nr:phospholipid carrier-dependent glycosyltransferase [Chloroflexaceae bacterium]